HPHQRHHRHPERRSEHDCGETILELAARTDRVKRGRLYRRIERRLRHPPLTFPPAANRASALTINVNVNNTNPAAIYAPVGSTELNSAAAEAILEAKV